MTTPPLFSSTDYSTGAEDLQQNEPHIPVTLQHQIAESRRIGIYGEDDSSDSLPLATRTQIVSRPIFKNISGVVEGLFRSRIFRTVLSTALVGLGVGILFLLISNPVGWIATAVGVSLLAAKFILAGGVLATAALFGAFAQFPSDDGTMEFELSALDRMTNENNYDEIPLNLPNGHKLYIGALPNALTDYELMQKIVGDRGTVIAINEDWELEPHGLSVPIEGEEYNELGINFEQVSILDHTILSPQDLDRLADKINKGLKNGNVYIHCRAGKGRSTTAAAAYLMKNQGKSIEEACGLIKGHRTIATIWNKLHGLRDYQAELAKQRLSVKPIPDSLNTAADDLKALEKAGKKRPKLPKATIEELQDAAWKKMQNSSFRTKNPILS